MNLEALLKEAANQDLSLPVLRDLADMGYTTVTYIAETHACGICRRFNNRRWKIEDFIKDTQYDAPIFSKTHVNDNCSLLVEGPGKQKIYVDYNGAR